jgi:protoporphyrinogen oxidase
MVLHVNVLLLLFTPALCTTATVNSPRVAVVGCGIGGSAFSFYLQDSLRNTSAPVATITAYERSAFVGGRLQHIIFGKQEAKIEVGGAAWTSSNQMMTELARRMNITVDRSSRSSRSSETISTTTPLHLGPLLNTKVGIWNGTGFAEIVKEVLNHLPSALNVLHAEEHFLHQISDNYAQVASEPPFTSISEFLSYGDLRQFTNMSIRSYFRNIDVDVNIIEEGLVPINRAIYNQNDNSSAFSLFGALTALENQESVPTGNSDLVRALLRSADVTLALNTTVTRVELLANGSYVVTDSRLKDEIYDVVVIASPLEITNITFVNVPTVVDTGGKGVVVNTIVNREYMPWYVTVVEADSVQKNMFSPSHIFPSNQTLPHVLLTTESGTTKKTPWVCIQPVGKHGKNGTDDKNVFMVYSDDELDVELMFVNPRVGWHVQHWSYTFPRLTPVVESDESKKFQDIVLASGLLNLNALESLATAMEVSSISAHNGARLALEHLESLQSTR